MATFGELLTSEVPVIVLFYSDWHQVSVAMCPKMQEIARALNESAKVYTFDADRNQMLADALRIKTIPTVLIYKDGQMTWRHSGDVSVEIILEQLK